ncbi:MAG: hypothetical protein JWP01_2489 [Myxococcales bacterium]|nr:hypothetical protein [Myxococcales bacterium]
MTEVQNESIGVARDSHEVHVCLEIRGCPNCRCRDIGCQTSDYWRDEHDRQVACFDLVCPGCGNERRIEFFRHSEYDSTKPDGHLGGPEPSMLIEPHELVIELLYDFAGIAEALAVVPPPKGWGHLLQVAEECLNELRKFFPEGADEIPLEYFRTDAAKAARAAHPEWFRVSYLEEQEQRFKELWEAGQREVARRDAAGETSQEPLPPLVAPLSPASVTLHAAWLADKEGGQRLEVKGIDATGKRLSAIDLTGATFEDVTLDRADLSYTHLHGATLTDVRARGAGFASTMLAGTTMMRCDFTAAGMPIAKLGDATIEDCLFTGANLERTTWYRSTVSRTSFADCVMHDVGVDKAVFTDCDFRGADLGIVKEGLLGTTMDAEFIRCDLRDTNWQGRELFRVRFIECKLAGTRGTPQPEKTVIERPDLSPKGDGSTIGTDRDVFALWRFDPDAPPPAPPPPTHRELVYDLTDDEGDYLEDFLKVKGFSVVKRMFRRGTELRFELRTWEPLSEPIAPLIETQLAKYRYVQDRRRAEPDLYVNPDGSTKHYAQLVAEDAIARSIDSGETVDQLVARLVGLGFTPEQAQEAIIDPSKARR